MQGFGMGRYVPPEHEGTISANKLQGKHALGNRARKAGEGILTVRFEMPFAIWCTGCPRETLIPQGVRFNAEKRRVGAYFSSPIFAFRMRHTACGNAIEIRTDPQNTAYVVTEGARKKDVGEDRPTEGVALQFQTEQERERLRDDAFAALETKIDDRNQATADQARIAELYHSSERAWDDPYAVNQRLRRSFRVGRKARETQSLRDEALQDRMSLGIPIAAETADDQRRAKGVEYGVADEAQEALLRSTSKGIFARGKEANRGSKKDALHQTLRSNSRVAIDPFLATTSKKPSKEPLLPALKRKRERDSPPQSDAKKDDEKYDEKTAKQPISLVNDDYGSD